jgi:hypothetical protein
MKKTTAVSKVLNDWCVPCGLWQLLIGAVIITTCIFTIILFAQSKDLLEDQGAAVSESVM